MSGLQQESNALAKKVLAEIFCVSIDEVKDDASIDTIPDWDSLAHIQVMTTLEKILDRPLEVDELLEAVSLKGIEMLIEKTSKLKIGNKNEDDLGPVINEKQLNNMLVSIEKASSQGGNILIGGKRLTDEKRKNGFYLEPTLIDNVGSKAEISQRELFGPIANLYKVSNYQEALTLANDSPYGLTGAIFAQDEK